jgi:DNA-binding MarR family transcriptional regulator
MATTPSTGGGLGYALMHAAQAWRAEAGLALKPHGLTVPQFLVIMSLYRQARHQWPPLTQAEVSTRLGMDANTTSQITRALATRGVVLRTQHPGDGRARELSLTSDGLELALDASIDVRAMNDRFFSAVTRDEQSALGAILHTITAESEQKS